MAASFLVLGAALAAASQPVERFRDVKEWTGTVTISKSGNGSAANEQVKTEFSLEERLSLSFTLRRAPDSTRDRPRWIGTADGGSSASIQETWKVTGVKEGSVIQSATCNGNELQGREVALTLNLRDKTYDLRFPDDVNYVCQGTMSGHAFPESKGMTSLMPVVKVAPADAASAYTPEVQERLLGFIGSLPRKLPESGTTLSGAKSFEAMPNKHTMLAPTPVTANVSWQIDGDAKPLELIVEPEGYESWRPLPGPDEATPGEGKLPIKATLQLRGGGEPPVKVKTFTFTLAEVSKEPGIAINFPIVPGPPRPDLRFENAGGFAVTEDGKVATKTGTPSTTATASLAAFDGGGWGVLTVTAILADDREVKGHLRSQPGIERILLPKRDQRSKISEKWKSLNGGGSDADDKEDEPAGDEHSGDGLTLYEEYRGFIENRVWKGGTPAKKDFFILDKMGVSSKDGIALFERASGLVVHHRFREDELRVDRVVNCNHAEGAHLADQHGVRLELGTELNFSIADTHDGNAGTPKHISEIRILNRVIFAERRSGAALYLNQARSGSDTASWLAAIAHELLHASNVYHHGENDRKKVSWTVTLDANGAPTATENGSPVTIRSEKTGQLWIPAGLQPGQSRTWDQRLVIGMKGGQHSGVDDCLMRYNTSSAYADAADPTLRWQVTEEAGFGLCDSKQGSGVNARNRPGNLQSRYGDATVGNCKAQLCVNDRHVNDHTPP